MELANGFRKLASGITAYFVDGVKAETEPCFWLIEIPSNNPEPDFPEDTYLIVECGAPLYTDPEGRFECAAGHSRGTLEEELGAGGLEWQREEAERAGR